MKKMFQKSTPGQLALYTFPGAIVLSLMYGGGWPALFGNVAAAAVVWFCIVAWAHGFGWLKTATVPNKLSAFDKALLSGLFVIPVVFIVGMTLMIALH